MKKQLHEALIEVLDVIAIILCFIGAEATSTLFGFIIFLFAAVLVAGIIYLCLMYERDYSNSNSSNEY